MGKNTLILKITLYAWRLAIFFIFTDRAGLTMFGDVSGSLYHLLISSLFGFAALLAIESTYYDCYGKKQ